jgi:hypothetical protein
MVVPVSSDRSDFNRSDRAKYSLERSRVLSLLEEPVRVTLRILG